MSVSTLHEQELKARPPEEVTEAAEADAAAVGAEAAADAALRAKEAAMEARQATLDAEATAGEASDAAQAAEEFAGKIVLIEESDYDNALDSGTLDPDKLYFAYEG